MQPSQAKHKPLAQESDLESGGEEDAAVEADHGRVGTILKCSLVIAFVWWFFALYTVISTRSLAVLASLVDATIDLFAQGVLLGVNWIAESGAVDGIYPVGVSRLEPVGVIICAVLMTLGSGGVIYESGETLVLEYPDGPDMKFTWPAAIMLAVVVGVKVVIWQIAKRESEKTRNVSLEALALDNFNDILSNFSSLVFASATCVQSWTWWFDPVGGIFISLYIIRSWGLTGVEQATHLVGVQADEDLVQTVRGVAEREAKSSEAVVDMVRAYHFGPKCMVEIKLIMDASTPLQQIRDVSIKLQHHVESIQDCERCFVQVDYAHRVDDDHDTNVPLKKKIAKDRRSNKSGLRLRTVLSFAQSDGGIAKVVDDVARRRTLTGTGSQDAGAASSTEAPRRDHLVSSTPRTIQSRSRDRA